MDVKKVYRDKLKIEREAIKEALKHEVEGGEKLLAMMGSPGWQLVERYITNQMEIAMKGLLTSKVIADIHYNRAVIATFTNLLESIGVSFQHATNAREKLKKYI